MRNVTHYPGLSAVSFPGCEPIINETATTSAGVALQS